MANCKNMPDVLFIALSKNQMPESILLSTYTDTSLRKKLLWWMLLLIMGRCVFVSFDLNITLSLCKITKNVPKKWSSASREREDQPLPRLDAKSHLGKSKARDNHPNHQQNETETTKSTGDAETASPLNHHTSRRKRSKKAKADGNSIAKAEDCYY